MERYPILISFFGSDWFNTQWASFRKQRLNFPPDSLKHEVIKLELELHPLLREVFRYQKLDLESVDFNLIPRLGASDFILSHLDRDLGLLKEEIAHRGGQIRRDLMRSEEFESHRFNILVASGYKLTDWSVEFVPTGNPKTPDLFLSKDKFSFAVECKQANQDIADRSRYIFAAELAERYLHLLRLKGLSRTLIEIEVNGNLGPRKDEIFTLLNKIVLGRQASIFLNGIHVTMSYYPEGSPLYSLLLQFGHFRKTPASTSAEDAFIITDHLTKNIILLDKGMSDSLIPKRVYDRLEDANKKDCGDRKLLVYFDIGKGFNSWNNLLSQDLYNTFNSSSRYPKIDGFVVCRTLPQYKGEVYEIRPYFNVIGSVVRLGDTPDNVGVFGLQGTTGMDHYILPDFFHPVA